MDSRALAVIDRLRAQDREQRQLGLPTEERTRNVGVETARYLYLVVRAGGPRRILEIGSSNGLSTIWLALGARSVAGSVTGTELIPSRAAEANAHLIEAGLDAVATVVPGDARETIASLHGPFDFVFLDAEKDGYLAHFDAFFPMVPVGGLVIADNVISHDCGAFQEMLRARSDLHTVTVPLERGLECTVRIA